MKVIDLKALAKERGLRGYSNLRKAELITFLQNNLQTTPAPRTRPPRPTRPPPPPPTWEPRPPLVRFRTDRPRQPELLRQLGGQPSPQETNIFEQQEMHKNRPQVTSELNDWHDWLVNHVPKPIKDKASRAFKTFKDKIMGLYNRVTGNEDQTQTLKPYQLKPKRGKETFIKPPLKQPPNQKEIKRMKKKLGKLNKKIRHSKKKRNNLISKQNSLKKKIEELKEPREPEPRPFNLVELEQSFGRAYRSYRINGRPKMDVDTFFDWIRQNLIDLINRELTDLGSAKVQMTTWIRFRQAIEDDFGTIIGFDRFSLPFNSRMMEIFQGSDLNEIVNEMLAHMKTQIENLALANSRFVFDEVSFLNVDFHQLKLARGSYYIPLPDRIARKKGSNQP